MTAPAGSQAVDRAAALLALVVESDRPRSFTSLVDEHGLARSTTSRLLAALERNRLVQRDAAGAFRPGPLFAAYAARRAADGDLVELARPAMDRLGRLTGETVNLAVPRADAVIHIAQVDSTYLLGASNWVGVDVPAHCTAVGKVFYAFGALRLPEGELDRRTPGSPAGPEDLERDLRAIGRRGWALAWEELEPGLVAVAAPVRAGDGSVVAAVSISGATARITRDDVERIAGLLLSETETISTLLGHRPQRHGGREGAA